MQSDIRLRLPTAPPADGGAEARGWPWVPEAGIHGRPPLDVGAPEAAPLAESMIRLLDEEGRATSAWPSALSSSALRDGLYDMKVVRAFDAKMLRAHRQGRTSFYMQSLGEEAIACAHARALEPGDMTFPTYRQQGLLIARGYPLVDMVNQVFSNSHDPLRGRQLPVFYSSRQYGFFSISGNLGTQYIQAVGWAMAAAIRRDEHIASAMIGEGATAEGDFHAALLFASDYRAPVLLNIVNNQWAISTFQDVARGGSPTFASRGLAFGIPSVRVDGNDYLAVHAVTQWAAERARCGHGPTLIEWVTYRQGAHSTSDDPSGYRDETAGTGWPLGDPIERLSRHLRLEHSWSPRDDEEQTHCAQRAVDEAAELAATFGTAKDGPHSDPATMFDDVYAELPAHLRRQRSEAGF